MEKTLSSQSLSVLWKTRAKSVGRNVEIGILTLGVSEGSNDSPGQFIQDFWLRTYGSKTFVYKDNGSSLGMAENQLWLMINEHCLG